MGCFVSGCDLGSILQVHFDLELNHVGVVVGGMDFAGMDCETEWFWASSLWVASSFSAWLSISAASAAASLFASFLQW